MLQAGLQSILEPLTDGTPFLPEITPSAHHPGELPQFSNDTPESVFSPHETTPRLSLPANMPLRRYVFSGNSPKGLTPYFKAQESVDATFLLLLSPLSTLFTLVPVVYVMVSYP